MKGSAEIARHLQNGMPRLPGCKAAYALKVGSSVSREHMDGSHWA